MEKVRAGKYVDFREMLPDNVALLEQLSTLGNSNPAPTTARLRELKDPLSWVFCFMYYIAASSSDPLTQQLAAYGQIVVHLCQKHGGSGWLAYDRLFRLQKAAGVTTSWEEINPSIMAATVLGGGSSATAS
jgi:hypothetical protein